MRRSLYPSRVTVLALVAVSLIFPEWFVATASALPEDRNQVLQIRSVRIESDQTTGTITYTGDVYIVQGSLQITADQVVINTTNDDVTELTATGRPATIQLKPSLNEEVVHGDAGTIQYDVVSEVMTFSGEASIRQGESSLQADRLEYDLREKRYEALSESATVGGQSERVRAKIPPGRLGEKVENE